MVVGIPQTRHSVSLVTHPPPCEHRSGSATSRLGHQGWLHIAIVLAHALSQGMAGGGRCSPRWACPSRCLSRVRAAASTVAEAGGPSVTVAFGLDADVGALRLSGAGVFQERRTRVWVPPVRLGSTLGRVARPTDPRAVGDVEGRATCREVHDVIEGRSMARWASCWYPGRQFPCCPRHARRTRALRWGHARVLYRALWRLRFDCRACAVQRLLGRLVTPLQTVQSFMALADCLPRLVWRW